MNEISIDNLDKQPISDVSKHDYKKRLSYLESVLSIDVKEMMLAPKKTYAQMKERISSKSATLVAYMTPICKMFSIHPLFAKQHEYEYKLWSSYLKQSNKERLLEYKTNNLPDAKKQQMVNYDAIKTKFCELSADPNTYTNLKQNLHHLLFAILLNITPKRSDLGEVYISRTGKIPKSFANKNFILLLENDARLVLNDYKTSKIYGTLVEHLPSDLVEVLNKSLEAFPRKYLFVGQIGINFMKPYTKSDSYGMFVRRAFEIHFNKSMGVSLWRHVYNGEQVDFNDDDYEELEQKARLAGHSMGMQLLVYKPRGENRMKRKNKDDLLKPLNCGRGHVPARREDENNE